MPRRCHPRDQGPLRLDEGPNRSGNSRRYLTRAIEASLRRLGTDYIDLYQVHRPDWDTDIERDVLPVAERWGMGVLTWSPLAFGFLTGRYRKGAEAPTDGRAALRPQWFDPADPVTARKLDVVEQLVDVADAVGCTLPALATAFPLAHRAVTSVIIGPRTVGQVEASLRTMDLRLDDDVLDRIDEIVPPGTEIYSPHEASRAAVAGRGEPAAPYPTRPPAPGGSTLRTAR